MQQCRFEWWLCYVTLPLKALWIVLTFTPRRVKPCTGSWYFSVRWKSHYRSNLAVQHSTKWERNLIIFFLKNLSRCCGTQKSVSYVQCSTYMTCVTLHISKKRMQWAGTYTMSEPQAKISIWSRQMFCQTLFVLSEIK